MSPIERAVREAPDPLTTRLLTLADDLEREAEGLDHGVDRAHAKRAIAQRIRRVVRGIE